MCNGVRYHLPRNLGGRTFERAVLLYGSESTAIVEERENREDGEDSWYPVARQVELRHSPVAYPLNRDRARHSRNVVEQCLILRFHRRLPLLRVCDIRVRVSKLRHIRGILTHKLLFERSPFVGHGLNLRLYLRRRCLCAQREKYLRIRIYLGLERLHSTRMSIHYFLTSRFVIGERAIGLLLLFFYALLLR